jgi:putative solute:sodium symporter small subunit
MDERPAYYQNGLPEPAVPAPDLSPETGKASTVELIPGVQETTEDGETNLREDAYWHENLRLLGGLMAIWFAASFGAGILFRDFLDQFMLGGYPLGFWFAQQGSIYVFIALIFYYVVRMKQIERKYDLDD